MRTARAETQREDVGSWRQLAADLLDEAFGRSEALRLGTPAARRKGWGQYFTAPPVAGFMASLLSGGQTERVRVFDPGAGTGILGLAAAVSLMSRGARHVELVAIEPEPRAREQLEASCARAEEVLGPGFVASVIDADVLALVEPERGTRKLAPFDVVISNPPYFKTSPADGKAGGSPNIYTRFMELSSRLLRPGGELCFIVPRSFASGPYFRRFRRELHQRMDLMRVHVFESRRAAFRDDGVLQENIVVCYRCLPRPSSVDDAIEVSASTGISDLDGCSIVRVPRASMLDPADPNALLALPANPEDLHVLHHVRSWPHTLADHGLEVSTGPVVPFRAKALLCRDPDGAVVAPLLWMQHVRADGVTWPLSTRFRKPEHILASAGEKLLVPNATYVLLRRFSAKEGARRLTAAPLLNGQIAGEWLGLENHLNFVHRPGGSLSQNEAFGLAALFNSKLLDGYFRIVSGSTQVNATDIRALPLPSLTEIETLGVAIRRGATSHAVEASLTAS
jgi:adenine-specific DNA-methyltransferase